MLISIGIPCYEMHGKGGVFLYKALSSIEPQTYKDFEVIISDHTTCNNTDVYKTYEVWKDRLNLKYIKNDYMIGSSSANANSCILNSRGKLIKILCQDDYLYDMHSLEQTVNTFDYSKKWLVSSYTHTDDGEKCFRIHHPYFSENIRYINRIGTHSCLTVLNDNPLLFDDNLIWYMDSDYYKRAFEIYGLPEFLKVITVVQNLWEGQVSNTYANADLKKKEFEYLKNKYGDDNGFTPDI